MTDDCGTREVLLNILQVLKKIEGKANGYEERLLRLEGSSTEAEQDTYTSKNHFHAYSKDDGKYDRLVAQDQIPPEHGKPRSKIYYSEWNTENLIKYISHSPMTELDASRGNLDEFSDSRLSKAVEERLGDYWSMPDDNRLPLKFSKGNILRSRINMALTRQTFYRGKQSFERELHSLCQFDREHRAYKGNDFMIVDFDTFNNSRIYRLGEPAIGPDLMVDLNCKNEAPWSRILLYQGSTTGGNISSNRRRLDQLIPYFTANYRLTTFWDHVSNHLQSKRRVTITNPYASSPWTGFHTTFYEICETKDPMDKEIWKNGPLYNHPLGWQFRKCAYTLYLPPSATQSAHWHGELARFWTILILSPSGFFNDHNRSFPMQELGEGHAQALGHCFGRLTQLGAEMNLIGHGLEKISERWTEFQAYFDYILDSSDSLMQPAEHDNLLFDDGAFSRSRKYFWAIECLTEFDNCITDNLTQWELYKAARVPIMLNTLSRLDQVQLSFTDRQYAVLQNQRESFRQKLTATKALRDALFNASAVIESRASTRLGENVKLLTFVSIFFLPLAFTTSLWSVNDKFSFTVLIYVIILVALSTYLIMFNINSLAQGFSRIYDVEKKKIVRAMKRDRNDFWRLRGHRFEIFRPKHDNPEPSEWYIPLYAFINPRAFLGCANPAEAKGKGAKPAKSKTHSHWLAQLLCFSRWKASADEIKERPDEGWVL